MAVREFVDARGVKWTAWDVTPEAMHPITAVEYFMADYREGWLCFESAAARRRLIGYPPDWAERSEAELASLCEQAELVQRRQPKARTRAAGQAGDPAGARADTLTPSGEHPAYGLNAVRTFVSSGGRQWTARVVTIPSAGSDDGERRVLRFSSSNLTLDVYEWPENWMQLEDATLASLALEGRPVTAPYPGSPGRKRPDGPDRSDREDRRP
ncbi:MAG TPA: hypothetical protein VNA89_13745 [Gemmatimonadaceae bacterium]|nr:hypothetical protein [Gemmatimonadaceae bacterium]